MEPTPIIFTNSSYKYLWPVIRDLTEGFGKVIFFLDRSDGFDFGPSAKLIHYSPADTYARRMAKLMELIDYEYILMLHDVDLPLRIDVGKLSAFLSLAVSNDLDRLSLGVFKSNIESDIVCDGELCATRLRPGMSANFYTPFDHSPSIWRRTSLLGLYKLFPDESYFSIEQNGHAQSYADSDLRCYGIHRTRSTNVIYHRGFAYSEDFNFMHITIQGKFMSRETYFDLLPEFERVVSRYGISLPTANTTFVSKNELPE